MINSIAKAAKYRESQAFVDHLHRWACLDRERGLYICTLCRKATSKPHHFRLYVAEDS
jgi:hypothetical protein